MRRTLLIVGVVLLAWGAFMAVSSARPDDGIDHGGNPCSGAIFEVLGIGSKDTNSAEAVPSEAPAAEPPLKSTIDYCRDAAAHRMLIAGSVLVLGAAVLVARWVLTPAPTRPLSPVS